MVKTHSVRPNIPFIAILDNPYNGTEDTTDSRGQRVVDCAREDHGAHWPCNMPGQTAHYIASMALIASSSTDPRGEGLGMPTNAPVRLHRALPALPRGGKIASLLPVLPAGPTLLLPTAALHNSSSFGVSTMAYKNGRPSFASERKQHPSGVPTSVCSPCSHGYP